MPEITATHHHGAPVDRVERTIDGEVTIADGDGTPSPDREHLIDWDPVNAPERAVLHLDLDMGVLGHGITIDLDLGQLDGFVQTVRNIGRIRPVGPFEGEWTDAMTEETALAMTGHPDTPLCPVCGCGVVDDLAHAPAHADCLPLQLALVDRIAELATALAEANDARAGSLARIDVLRARVTELEAEVHACDEAEESWSASRRGLETMLMEERQRVQVLAAQRKPIGYVIGTDIPGKIELYEDRVLTKEESVEWLTNLKANKPADIWRAFGLIEVTE